MIDRKLLYVVVPALLLGGGVAMARQEDPQKTTENADDAPVFSGPQKGERLPPFKVTGVYDDLAGKELDWVTAAGERPILLIFVHKLTRPSFGLTRMLTAWAADRDREEAGKAEQGRTEESKVAQEKLVARIVWLDDDRSKAQEYLTRARKSLGTVVPIGISVDGAEGPGSYGLDRNVTLTVLVGVKGKVTANFALVQPSDTDAPRILAEVAAVIGEKAPTPDDLARYGRRYTGAGNMRAQMRKTDPKLRRLVNRLQASDLDDESAGKIVAEIEKYTDGNRAKLRDLGVIATVVSSRESFASSGTERTRRQVREWAKKHGGRAGRRPAARPGKQPARPGRQADPELVAALRPVIGKDLSPEEVDRAAARAEKYIEEHAQSAGEVVRIGRVVLEKEYGTPRAREHFQRWVKKYAKKTGKSPGREEKRKRREKKEEPRS